MFTSSLALRSKCGSNGFFYVAQKGEKAASKWWSQSVKFSQNTKDTPIAYFIFFQSTLTVLKHLDTAMLIFVDQLLPLAVVTVLNARSLNYNIIFFLNLWEIN